MTGVAWRESSLGLSDGLTACWRFEAVEPLNIKGEGLGYWPVTRLEAAE